MINQDQVKSPLYLCAASHGPTTAPGLHAASRAAARGHREPRGFREARGAFCGIAVGGWSRENSVGDRGLKLKPHSNSTYIYI